MSRVRVWGALLCATMLAVGLASPAGAKDNPEDKIPAEYLDLTEGIFDPETGEEIPIPVGDAANADFVENAAERIARELAHALGSAQSLDGRGLMPSLYRGKWFKPGKGVFQIRYSNDADYEPDFVVETETEKLICEPKGADRMEDPVVLAKARAAATWCQHGTTHETANKGKPWRYLLIPHDAIADNMTLDGLAKQFTPGLLMAALSGRVTAKGLAQMVLSMQPVDAQTALTYGLIGRIVPAGGLADRLPLPHSRDPPIRRRPPSAPLDAPGRR